MTATKAQRGAAKERERCLGIVMDYREDIERRLALKPNASNARDVRKVIKMLGEIETLILELEAIQQPNVVYPGDLSVEEMERAQEIIAEQERNPFEV